PGILVMRIPVVIEGILVDHDSHRGVADRTAEVIVSLNIDLDFFAQPERFLPAVLFRSLYRHFEFRQLVLLEAKQPGAADTVFAAQVPELNVVLPERQLLAQLKRTPGAAKTIERGFAFRHFRPARVVDLVLDYLVRGR